MDCTTRATLRQGRPRAHGLCLGEHAGAHRQVADTGPIDVVQRVQGRITAATPAFEECLQSHPVALFEGRHLGTYAVGIQRDRGVL